MSNVITCSKLIVSPHLKAESFCSNNLRSGTGSNLNNVTRSYVNPDGIFMH